MTNILIVDDSRTAAYKHAQVLKKAGYNTSLAHGCEEGITKVITTEPDLILVGEVTRNNHCYEATQNISKDPLTAHIPIVLMTSNLQDNEMDYGIHMGATDYLNLPVEEDVLITAVNCALN